MSTEDAITATPAEVTDFCLECHTDQQRLMDTAVSDETSITLPTSDILVGDVESVEVWQKVLVDKEQFPTSIHGLHGCISCHGGVQSPEKDSAHQGVISNPSQDAQAICGECHPDIVVNYDHSLHNSLQGFWRELDIRAPSNHRDLQPAFDEQCSSCHTTCGECHVSLPSVAGGGFVNGHLFNRTPSMEKNCIVCHASRAGNEYTGRNQGLPADVHFQQGLMECVDCHKGSELHGEPGECKQCHPGPQDAEIPIADHRYAGIQTPRCESCHPDVSTGQDGIMFHEMHGANLSCQVCHSVAYTNCDGCHLSQETANGKPSYDIEKVYSAFFIGRNPIQSYERPYRYVPVRHVPIVRNTFENYGANLLTNFDELETWKNATPHNIQRRTPQTETCNACHGNAALFLTADKVSADELQANRDVIIQSIPPMITSGSQLP
jgi:thiosulfate/3-mercaptopyruvate sulfurtransferase